jgi:hypothetical protein
MDEHVLAAAFRLDESKTLGGVEELYGSDGHLQFPSSEPSGQHARAGAMGNDHRKVAVSSRRAQSESGVQKQVRFN